VPFAQIADEVGHSTRLVACSHVSWVSGQVVDTAALAACGAPVLLDAAQALGAVPAPVEELGSDFYACSGQKWLCGPEGSGCLYVAPDRIEELEIPWPSYVSLADSHQPLELKPAEGAPRFDLGFPSALRSAFALAALEVLREADWDWIYERAATLAASLADDLSNRGLHVLPRGRSTLVTFRTAGRDAQEEVEQLAGEGFVVRSIPLDAGLIRVSVGAWSDEPELERLVELVAR
jgi:L-cysteine/cystine lyase